MGVDIGKDAADAAREAPLGSIDTEELHRFAQELEAEGNDNASRRSDTPQRC